MDYFTTKRLFDMYGFTTDFSNLIPDSIRYPPHANVPKGLMNTHTLREKLFTDNAALNPKLEDLHKCIIRWQQVLLICQLIS